MSTRGGGGPVGSRLAGVGLPSYWAVLHCCLLQVVQQYSDAVLGSIPCCLPQVAACTIELCLGGFGFLPVWSQPTTMQAAAAAAACAEEAQSAAAALSLDQPREEDGRGRFSACGGFALLGADVLRSFGSRPLAHARGLAGCTAGRAAGR